MKIFVRGTNWIGDAVMQIPALRELRRAFPAARITLGTREWTRGIFADADFIDEILTFEKDKSVFSQAKKIRAEKFDLAILFTNSFAAAAAAKLGRAKKIFGYASDGRSLLLTDALEIPAWKNEKHEIFYYLNIVAEVEKNYRGATNILEREPHFDLKISKNRRNEARRILAANAVDLSKRIVAFCPGSTNSRAKRWQAESYAALNDKIQKDLDANVILIGAADEAEVSVEVFEKSRVKPISLTGKTSLAESAAILGVCDLLVSNDTGPAHIAAAIGTKTIVIFGPTNPLTTQPWNSVMIKKDVECAPCMLRDCPIDHRCLTAISADEVFGTAANLLGAE